MKSTAKELALGGMFTALGVVFLCLGGIVPLALYACPAPGVGRAAAGAGELPEECRLELLRSDRRARDAAWPG